MNASITVAADVFEQLHRDARRYRFLRDTFFTFDFMVPPNFTGEVIVAPPRSEEFVAGASITKNWLHSAALDAVIDAALDGKIPASVYVPIKDVTP